MWRPKGWGARSVKSCTHKDMKDCTGREVFEVGADAMLKAILSAMPSREVFKQQIHRVCYNDLDMKDFKDWVYQQFRGQFEDDKRSR